MSKMAPVCVCGHKASEHRKQMSMRTYCMNEVEYQRGRGTMLDGQPSAEPHTAIESCPCLMYRPKEAK